MSDTVKTTGTTFNVKKPVASRLRLMATLEGVKVPELIERMVADRAASYPEHVKLTLAQLSQAEV